MGQAYYNEKGQLLGYVELSNGPAYGRDILRSVAWGWAIAALTAAFLAAAAGVWVSRRFSAPLENLTSLRKLDLQDNPKLTEGQVEELRSNLPDGEIVFFECEETESDLPGIRAFKIK